MEPNQNKTKTGQNGREVLRMSNKESNRITRECLRTALIALMGQKPFDKISVSEIVRRSGVSRTAFYRNYSTKEDILNEACNAFLDSIAASFSGSRFRNDRRGWYHDYFQDIREHADTFRLLLQAHMVNTPVFSSLSLNRKLNPPAESASPYDFLAWAGALSSVPVHWFQNGMKESDDFMADFCVSRLPVPGNTGEYRESDPGSRL